MFSGKFNTRVDRQWIVIHSVIHSLIHSLTCSLTYSFNAQQIVDKSFFKRQFSCLTMEEKKSICHLFN